MSKPFHIFQSRPFYLYLLSVLFVLHGFRENYNFIPVTDALFLTGLYLFASTILLLGFWLFFRDWRRAGLAGFFVMALHFFFGSMHDLIKDIFSDSFITKYTFILPVFLILLLILIFLLKKKKPLLLQTTYYLNILLLLLIAIDIALLFPKIIRNKNLEAANVPGDMIRCDTCIKPDIYFIIPDEYAGNNELKDVFYFDNSDFISELSKRGFHTLPYSYSNYNYTPFSIASALNMQYLDLKGKDRSQPDLAYCYEMIRNNRLLNFLHAHHYSFFNYSFFNFEGQPARVRETFLPAKTRLITGQTLLSRIDRDLRFNLITRFRSKRELRKQTYANKQNNENIIRLTTGKAAEETKSPKFVFTHLMMPHYPYYYDKNGNERQFEELIEGNQVNQQHYVEYLQYCNKRLLDLVDHILKSSKQPPIIVLMGDHGFRHFNKPVDLIYYFLNLTAVYLPSKNYQTFTDTLTSVNLFRKVLNTEFGQRLPLLKDSISYLRD